MSHEVDTDQMMETLETFQKLFNDYASHIFGRPEAPGPSRVKGLLTELRQMEPKVTEIITTVDGARSYTTGSMVRQYTVSNRDLLRSALLGGNNAMPHNFSDFDSIVTAAIDSTIGVLKAGLWPLKIPAPVLIPILDKERMSRVARRSKKKG